MLDFNHYEITEIYRPRYTCMDYLPLQYGGMNVLAAIGGVGKTFLTIELAIRHLIEKPLERAYVWTTEDESGISKDRAFAIAARVLS